MDREITIQFKRTARAILDIADLLIPGEGDRSTMRATVLDQLELLKNRLGTINDNGTCNPDDQ